jgi:hypothetical protein
MIETTFDSQTGIKMITETDVSSGRITTWTTDSSGETTTVVNDNGITTTYYPGGSTQTVDGNGNVMSPTVTAGGGSDLYQSQFDQTVANTLKGEFDSLVATGMSPEEANNQVYGTPPGIGSQPNPLVGTDINPSLTGSIVGTGTPPEMGYQPDPLVGTDINPGLVGTGTPPGEPSYDPENLNLDPRFTTGGTNPNATSGDVQYGDEFDPTFGLLRVLYGDDVANRYRGGGLAQVDAQNLIDMYQRQVEDLAFDRTANLAGQEQGLVNQLREIQRGSDLGLLQNYGPSYAQALYNTDQVAANQLSQQNAMSNRLYREAEGNFSDSRQAQITEDAFQTSALQGRERDPSMLYERLIGSEQARADREARAQLAGGNTFNMSRNFTSQIPGLLLGAGSSPYERGVGTISPVYGATDAVGAAQQNYQNTQNYLDNQRAQQAYQQSIDAAREANDLNALEKLQNGFNTFSSGLQTAQDAFSLIGGLGETFKDIASTVSQSNFPGAGVVSGVADTLGGLLGSNTNTSTATPTYFPDSSFNNAGALAGAAGGLASALEGSLGGDTSGSGITYGASTSSNPFATDISGIATSGSSNPFATDISGIATNAGSNGFNDPYVATPTSTTSSSDFLSGLGTLGSGAIGVGSTVLNQAGGLIGSGIENAIDLGSAAIGVGGDVIGSTVDTVVDIWGSIFGGRD